MIRKVQPNLVWIQHHRLTLARRIDELATELEVTPQTIRRWYRNPDSIPRTVRMALRFLLGEINHPDWSSAHVSPEDGTLWMETDRRGHTAAQVENWSQVFAHRDALERELQELRQRVAALLHGSDLVNFPWKMPDSPDRHTTHPSRSGLRQVSRK